jgi:hypothetical protein
MVKGSHQAQGTLGGLLLFSIFHKVQKASASFVGPGNSLSRVWLANLEDVLQFIDLGVDGITSKVEVELGLQLKQRPKRLELYDDMVR